MLLEILRYLKHNETSMLSMRSFVEDPLVDENYSFLELALPLVLESHKHCMISTR